MPFAKLILRPTVNRQFTPTLNQAGISYSQRIRFQSGLPEKLGGWQRMTEDRVTGTASGMHSWASLNGNKYLAIGSDQRLAIFAGGVLDDMTPVRATTTGALFTTDAGPPATAIVTITDVGRGTGYTNVGDWILLLPYVWGGGVVLQGYYEVASVLTADTYTIFADTVATATLGPGINTSFFDTLNLSTDVTVTLDNHGFVAGDVYTVHVSTLVGLITFFDKYTVQAPIATNTFHITGNTAANGNNGYEGGGASGTATIKYLIPTGFEVATSVTGYGMGYYGLGLYGVASPAIQAVAPLRQWSMDNWGEQLVATYTNGPIYYWQPPPVIDTASAPDLYMFVPAAVLPVVYAPPDIPPVNNICLFISMPARILVVCGTEVVSAVGPFDPNLVRWSGNEDYSRWVAAITNQAGSFRIPTGSKIVGALLSAQQGLIWTDLDVWSMQYIGLPFVFSFNKIQTNCGLIAQRAATTLGSQVFWMSQNNFFTYGPGGFKTLECTVHDIVFDSLDTMQTGRIFAWANPLFNEVSWFYPINGSDGAVGNYVKLNTESGSWDYGEMDRSAGDAGSVYGAPISVDSSRRIQQHDVQGVYDADGDAMTWFVESGYFDLAEGQDYVFVDRLLPDFVFVTGTRVNITLTTTDYPEGPETVYGPYAFRCGVNTYMPVRVRGRQMKVKIEGHDAGSFARLGAIRYQIAQDGRN